MTLAAALSSVIVPFGIGLCVGLLIGVITGVASTLRWIEHRRRQEKLVPIYRDDTNPTPGHVPWRGDEHLSKFGWLLAIMGTLAIIGSVVSLVQDRTIASCLSGFVQGSAATNQARAEAAELDRQAIRQQRQITREFNQLMIDAVANPPADPAAREQSRLDFLDKARSWNAQLAEVDGLDQQAAQRRLENPLPPQPAC